MSNEDTREINIKDKDEKETNYTDDDNDYDMIQPRRKKSFIYFYKDPTSSIPEVFVKSVKYPSDNLEK